MKENKKSAIVQQQEIMYQLLVKDSSQTDYYFFGKPNSDRNFLEKLANSMVKNLHKFAIQVVNLSEDKEVYRAC